MKKITKTALAVLSVSVLAACSTAKPIDEETAKARAKEIVEKHEKGEVEIPNAFTFYQSTSMTDTYSDGEETVKTSDLIEAKLVLDVKKQYCYTYAEISFSEEETGEEALEEKIITEAWVYKKGNLLYEVANIEAGEESQKKYVTLDLDDEATKILAEKEFESYKQDALEAIEPEQYLGDEGMLFGEEGFVHDFNESIASGEGFTGKVEYFSKGSGSLEIKAELTASEAKNYNDDGELSSLDTGSAEITFAYQDYLLSNLTIKSDITATFESTHTLRSEISQVASFSKGAKLQYPDLSNYTLIQL